jgi:hypothetical protein
MATLPDNFRPLLWSYNFSATDPERHKKTIITQTINYGDLHHWRWLVRFYGKEAIRQIVSHIPVSEFRPRVRKLAALLFSIDSFNHAPRGTGRKE